MKKIKTITVKANVNIEAIPLTANLVARVVRNNVMLDRTVKYLAEWFAGENESITVLLSREEVDAIINRAKLLRDIENSFVGEDDTDEEAE